MKHLRKGMAGLVPVLVGVLFLFLSASFALAAPQVNVMPSGATDQTAYTWVGNNLTVWGNVNGGAAPYVYEWDINSDGTAECSGVVGNERDISCAHTYAAAGLFDAVLRVTDINGDFASATVRIKVLPATTKPAQINLAIERGLKWLYLMQNLSTGSIYWYNSYSSAGAETAAAILAFENRNHKPCTLDQDADGDVDAADRAIWENGRIYAETVHKGLDYAISTLVPEAIGIQGAGDPDTNGNGVGIRDSNYNRAPYKIGMYMMALVGAGTKNSGAPELLATTGPGGVVGKTYRQLVEDMVDWSAGAQNDPATGGYRGGWRYTYNYGNSDNSACQWPVIGMEAAEHWDIFAPAFVKAENELWTTFSQYFTGYSPAAWYYGAFGYTGKGTGIALTGAGMCQLSYQGKPKTDGRILAAAQYLSGNTGGNMYDMYAVAKAARIAKVDTNSDGIGDVTSEIEQLNGWDWYETYSTRLLSQQQSDGRWYTTYYPVFDTAWAVEILTKNVFTLRPVATLVASPNPTPANSLTLPAPVTFNACNSTHQDSTKLLASWRIDVDNDGIYDLTGNFPACTVVYPGYPDMGGDYTVTAQLEVTDNIGDSASNLLAINVTSGNVPPVVKSGGPYHGNVGSPIIFDGSASYDPNAGQGITGDHIVSWEWDLDGDGLFDDASGAVVSATWNSPYSGIIGLKVCDDAGLCADTSTSGDFTQVFAVNLWPDHYVLVSRTRVSRTVYDYEYRFFIQNNGNITAGNVVATIDKVPAQVTVIDGVASFGDIASGVKGSTDTFKLRADRSYPVAGTQVRWKVEYDDAGGAHVVMLDLPIY